MTTGELQSKLHEVPNASGVYYFSDEKANVIYVGKAKNLFRRLSQYATPSRKKKNRKRAKILNAAASLRWQETESDVAALLLEIDEIQKLKPKWNVAGAFDFLYPYLLIKKQDDILFFGYTTRPQAFSEFETFGAFRCRLATGTAFFELMTLLEFLGHPISRRWLKNIYTEKFSYVFGFRRLPESWAVTWGDFFSGRSRQALEDLSVSLLEKISARKKAHDVQKGLRALGRFWKDEALPLRKAVDTVGEGVFPVAQRDRDPLFIRYRAMEAQEK